MKRRICLLVCDNYRHEAEAAAKAEGIDGESISIVTYDSNCHRRSAKKSRLDVLLQKFPFKTFDAVYLLGGGCLSGQADIPASVRMLKLESCFCLLLPPPAISEFIRQGAYLLTPGWLQRWRGYMTEWGFDKVVARSFFGESVSRLMLLDSGMDTDAGDNLRDFAEFIDRPYEILPVGLELIQYRLGRLLMEDRLLWEATLRENDVAKACRHQADYAMAFDLTARLTRVGTEKDVAAAVLEIMELLFAPTSAAYVPLQSRWLRETIYRPRPVSLTNADISKSTDLVQPPNGIAISLSHGGERLAVIELHDVVMPEYLEDYRNLALAASPVFALAVANARILQQLRKEEMAVQKDVQLAGTVQRQLLPEELSNENFSLKTAFSPQGWVSGDFFGFRWFAPKNVLRGYLLDVTGHGVATALQTAAISAVCDDAVNRGSPDEELMTQLNRKLMPYFAEGSFAALLMFEFDFSRSRLSWVNGGINRTLVGSAGLSGWVTVPGSYVGILDEVELNTQVMELSEGDTFYFMTDGLSELLEKTGVPENPLDFAGTVGKLHAASVAEQRWDDCTAICIRVNRVGTTAAVSDA